MAVTNCGSGSNTPAIARITIPVANTSDWLDVVTDLTATDNSGSSVVNPVGSITAATRYRAAVASAGTSVLVRMKYKATVSTPPVVQVFGLDTNSVPMRLKDSGGNHELTMTTAATDATDASSWFYTEATELDVQCCASLLVGVKTAITGSGNYASSTIQIKVK